MRTRRGARALCAWRRAWPFDQCVQAGLDRVVNHLDALARNPELLSAMGRDMLGDGDEGVAVAAGHAVEPAHRRAHRAQSAEVGERLVAVVGVLPGGDDARARPDRTGGDARHELRAQELRMDDVGREGRG